MMRRWLTGIAAGGGGTERAEALAALVSTARSYGVHRGRTASVRRTPPRSVRAFIAALGLSTLVACWPRTPPAPPLRDVHHHVVPVHQPPWATNLAPDARLVPVEGLATGSDSVVSPDGRWRAIVHTPPDEPGGRIWIELLSGAQRAELRGLPLPYRPLTAVVWLDANHLAFDRWSQPHHGMHYVLDIVRRRLVLAAPFPDSAVHRVR
jgi:hypothetical protein